MFYLFIYFFKYLEFYYSVCVGSFIVIFCISFSFLSFSSVSCFLFVFACLGCFCDRSGRRFVPRSYVRYSISPWYQ